MKKLILVVILFSLLLVSCGSLDRGVAYITGYSKQCIDGVEYIQFSSGASVSYTTAGEVKTCK